MYPPAWGPYQWLILHTMAWVYPDTPSEDRQASMRMYLQGMSENLPCPGCSYHCIQYFQDHPPDVSGRMAFFHYTVDMHNSVNRRLGKREWTYEEAAEDLQTKTLNIQKWMELERCAQIQLEDHRKMKELEHKNENLCRRDKVAHNVLVAGIVSAVLAVIICTVCLFFVQINKKKKKHEQG